MNTNLILCDCQNYALLSFIENNRKEILIKCDLCGNKKKSLHNYLQSIASYNKLINKDANLCKIHNQVYSLFCIQCKIYLCHGCNKEPHQSHNCESLSDYIPTNKLTSKLKDGYKFIDNYCKLLKKKKMIITYQ